MMIRIVGLTKTLCSITPLGEETSILAVDSEDKEEEEVWFEAEERSSIITAHSQDISQGTVITLALLATIATPSSMLSRNVQHYWLNFRRDEDLNRTHKYN